MWVGMDLEVTYLVVLLDICLTCGSLYSVQKPLDDSSFAAVLSLYSVSNLIIVLEFPFHTHVITDMCVII